MEKLEKDANLEQIIAKINEIIEVITQNNIETVIPFDEKTLSADVREYFDGTGGMVK